MDKSGLFLMALPGKDIQRQLNQLSWEKVIPKDAFRNF